MTSAIVSLEILLLVVSLIQTSIICEEKEILLFHSNNIYSELEESEENTGGAARALHLLTKARNAAKDGTGPPVLYLNAGDNLGSSYLYHLHGWEIVASFMNVLRPDVMCLGNHDFDNGTVNLARFLHHTAVPVVGANINVSKEKILLGRIQPNYVFSLGNFTIGVIGYTTTSTKVSSSAGNVEFNDEIESVKRESERLHKMGVKIIIALGHAGYTIDKKIAKQTPHVDVVVGGHRKTWMEDPNHPRRHVPEAYRRSDRHQVVVVHEYGYLNYLGMVKIRFDDNGDVKSFVGQPILLHKRIPQHQTALKLLNTYRARRQDNLSIAIGSTKVVLSSRCLAKECNLANLVLDALCDFKAAESTEAGYWNEFPIAIINGGVFRRSINVTSNNGHITNKHIMSAIRFDDYLCTLDIMGLYLLQALEQGVKWKETSTGELLQVSGLHIVYNFSKPNGARVVRAYARCGKCRIPTYKQLDRKRTYTLITTQYIHQGLGGHTVFIKNSKNFQKSNKPIRDVVAEYITKYKTLSPEIEDRFIITNNGRKLGLYNCVLVSMIFCNSLLYVFLMRT